MCRDIALAATAHDVIIVPINSIRSRNPRLLRFSTYVHHDSDSPLMFGLGLISWK
jgi:hypothetical protein